MSHGNRYLDLAVRAGSKKLDSSYRAAFYLLSHDPDIAKAAGKYISYDGINFAAIKRATRGFDETSRQVIDIAHNLFSWTSKCSTTPFDMSQLGYPYMEMVCNAIFIVGGQYEVMLEPEQENQVTLTLDKENYEQTKQIHRQMNRIYAQMLESQDAECREWER